MDVYFAEQKIVETLPKFYEAAKSVQLKDAFMKHLGETKIHVERLEQVFKIIGKEPEAKTCDAILGITDEGEEIMEEYAQAPPRLMPVFWPPRRRWTTKRCRATVLCALGRSELGLNDAAGLLQTTLDEEQATDLTLTAIATSVANQKAEG